jgi:diphosphomevalonate decarboxylase
MKVTVKANTNIALVKYWGKRDTALKLPLNNSISLTLEQLYTETSVEIIENAEDELLFNNENPPVEVKNKIFKFVDLFRKDFSREKLKFRIKTANNFPTASGLASSASGFAALATAMNKVMQLELNSREISRYARIGSGSASRSIYGGFVEWQKGVQPDGSDSYAVPIVSENYWDIRMLVVIVDDLKKTKSSTDGMAETVKTCPFYPAWLDTIEEDLNIVREGIIEKDLEKVGEAMEHNCLKMHSTMFTTKPAVIYWKPGTLAIIHQVHQMRHQGIFCYFTIDAGANVKILCLPEAVEKIKANLADVKEIKQIIECRPGSAPEIIT